MYFLTVNYYSTDLIRAMLASLAANGDRDYHVVLVNNSPDDLALNDLAIPDRVTVLTAPRNLGFGGGCNLGLRWIEARDPRALIWLFNPDAELVPGAIAYVRQCFQAEPKLGILGTRIVDFDGNLWFSRGRFNPWTGSLKHRDDAVETGWEPPQVEPSRWVSGCSMIFNPAALSESPRFDEQYFLDYEDADICERHGQLGDRVAVTQAILVKHQVSAVTHRDRSQKFRHATFSKLYFLHQHATPFALGLNLIYMPLKMLWFLLRGKADIAQGRWQGWLEFGRWWGARLGRSRLE